MKNKKIWVDYEERFLKEAKKLNYSEEEKERLLNYAKDLHDKQMPIIYDGIHLSYLLGFKVDFIYGITNSPRNYYRSYKIPKKQNGKFRDISEPLPNLKEIQYWIIENILSKFRVSGYVKSYVKKRSIKDNAKYHIGKKYVLTLDIKKYFPSFSFGKVYNFFLNIGYIESVAMVLAKLCYFNGLPQGAPTSPILSNILTQNIDRRVSIFCRKNKINYTRYADDLTFSGDFKVGKVIKIIEEILKTEGFELNKEKIRVRKKNSNQEVTGITVNEKLQASKKLRHSIRQEVYYIRKFGIEEHIKEKNGEIENIKYHLDRLIGECNFIIYINPSDEEYIGYKEFLLEEKRKFIENLN